MTLGLRVGLVVAAAVPLTLVAVFVVMLVTGRAFDRITLGALILSLGLLPVGFARSTAGEYAGNIFWVVAFSLIISWIVAVWFTPYMGVKLLPEIKVRHGGHNAIYKTRNYQRLRTAVRWCVDHKWPAAGATAGLFVLSLVGMGGVTKQFFPNSERPELSIEVNMPPGSAFGATDKVIRAIETALRAEPKTTIVSSYIGPAKDAA